MMLMLNLKKDNYVIIKVNDNNTGNYHCYYAKELNIIPFEDGVVECRSYS